MTTATDPFVAVLTQRMIARERKRLPDLEIPGVRAHEAPPIPGLPTYQGKPAPQVNTVNVRDLAKASHRPDYADDIDRIVQGLVNAGDVVWDATSNAYRAPHYRRFKFV